MKMEKAWRGFKGTKWQENIDVADFIKENYKEYKGDESFLETPTLKTKKVWSVCEEALKVELDKGIYDVEVNQDIYVLKMMLLLVCKLMDFLKE